MTYALRGARARAAHTLAAAIARAIALIALAALGLSGHPVHEPVHAPRLHAFAACYVARMLVLRQIASHGPAKSAHLVVPFRLAGQILMTSRSGMAS